MITMADYWMGRDTRYRLQWTGTIQLNGSKTVDRVNQLLDKAAQDGVEPGLDPVTGTPVSSGWRPAIVNDKTSNAADNSKHIDALACDVRDTPSRSLASWCLKNLDKLEKLGLWMEDPRWTPHWVHLQKVPPRSGNRVYRPSMAAPLAEPLPEQVST